MGERKRGKDFFASQNWEKKEEKGIKCFQEEDSADTRGKAPTKPKWNKFSQIKDRRKYFEA